MEGYRAGLILAAPEFDTYGCLKRFAEKPDRAGVIGFQYLMRRCELHLAWELSGRPGAADHWRDYMKLRTGAGAFVGAAASAGNAAGGQDTFMGMPCGTEEQRAALFDRCLKTMGRGH